ncbi:MAG: hypothetical protein AAGA91_10535 [Pseudomonadota bacterium]
MRISLVFLLGMCVGAALAWGWTLREQAAPETVSSADMAQSVEQLAAALVEATSFVEQHAWYGTEQEQAEAYHHLLSSLMNGLESYGLSDPDFPFFHELNTRNKVGMDNSDQRYLIARLRGDAAYRVWGNRGTSRRMDITLYEEDDLSASIASIMTEQLETDENGDFELFIGGEPRSVNWLPSHIGPGRLLIRQQHSDWETESPGRIHIDRIDSARPVYPQLRPLDVTQRVDAVTDYFASSVRRWPEMGRTRIAALFPVNTLSGPRDVGGEGGLSGRIMVGGHYKLAADEALIITTRPTGASYQGIQLGSHWWQSLDYANRQTSLTTDQAHLSSDGAYHFIVSEQDPGYSNWLDTSGLPRGLVLLRFDGLPQPELSEGQIPSARVVPMSEVVRFLPGDEPLVTPEQRRAVIAGRRQHVQRRFGY